MRGNTTLRTTVGGILVALALAGCGADGGGLGSKAQGSSPAAPTASAPVSAPAATPNATTPAATAPASPDPMVGPPAGDASAAPAAPTTSPAKTWPMPIAGIREVDFTHTGASGVMKTQVTLFKCDAEPVSGIYLESQTKSNAAPFGDVPLGENAYKQVKVTHHVPASADSYVVNFGCGYADGGNHDWKFVFNNIWIDPGKMHTITCTTSKGDPFCVLDGIQRVAG